ncbi:MAG: DUF6044 family protein, partial [Bacteroidota bacterium]
GLPTSALYPYYDLSFIPFKLFGIYWGNLFNKTLMSLIGFWGMYILLKKHFLKDVQWPILIVGPALIYALLPYWSYMASVAGLPAIFYAFLNLYAGKYTWINWAIIFFYAFHSSLILCGMFLMILLGFMGLYDAIKRRKINFGFFLGLLLLGIAYIGSHFPLMHAFFSESGFISHRVEFQTDPHSWQYGITKSLTLFTTGHFLAYSVQGLMIIPVLGVFFIPKIRKNIPKPYTWMLLFIALSSLFHGFKDSYFLLPWITAFTDVFPIQLHRFFFLHPLFWYVLFAWALWLIFLEVKNGRRIAMVFLSIQLILVCAFHESIRFRDKPSYAEFVATDAFEEVKQLIGKPQESYRVISVGMHPSSSQLNGFYTLDAYSPSYPLSYKHKLRKIIAHELERNPKTKKHFDAWGSHAYALSSERHVDFLNNQAPEIQLLDYNYEALKEMGGEYIFCPTSINLSKNPALEYLGKGNGSYWKIYVYRIK